MEASSLVLFQSVPFRDALAEIRATQHPARTLLPESFSMEQRGIHQLRIEEFEKIMTTFESLGRGQRIHSVASTYGVDEIPQPITR